MDKQTAGTSLDPLYQLIEEAGRASPVSSETLYAARRALARLTARQARLEVTLRSALDTAADPELRGRVRAAYDKPPERIRPRRRRAARENGAFA